MISPELIRRYPFFAGLNHDYVGTLAKLADGVSVEAGHCFFREGAEVNKLYLVLEGAVAIVIAVPDRETEQPLSGQLTGNLSTKDITVTTVGTGGLFAWSALIPPHKATASAKALTPCRVLALDCKRLRPIFEQDRNLAYLMTLKAAQIVRDRLRDLRIETLAENAKGADIRLAV
jgi:CRP/FNR family cyclic AMP-dependent transcriptional regulator